MATERPPPLGLTQNFGGLGWGVVPVPVGGTRPPPTPLELSSLGSLATAAQAWGIADLAISAEPLDVRFAGRERIDHNASGRPGR